MSADIDAVIAASIADIDGGSDGGDTNDTGDAGTDDTGDVPTAGSADTGADASADDSTDEADPASGLTPDPVVDTRTADDIALDTELAELGLAAPKPGQRDNRIPYSRIRKIVANAKTKWSEKLTGEHKAALTERDTKVQEFDTRDKNIEQFISNDPEGYINLLANLYPQHYKKFVGGGEPKEDPAVARAKADPEPQVDIKYDDGSYGYSPEQFAKVREWDRREAARVAKEQTTKEFNERFGPIEKEYKATQQTHEDTQRVRGHIGKLREQWGPEVIDDPKVQADIVAYMDANPKVTLVAAAREIVNGRRATELLKLRADRNTMRADLIKELKGAPRAAARAPVASVRSDAGADETYEQIIRDSMKGIQ
jgi:hypothetical protein